MDTIGPEHTFLGLPLISEQESEIQHYLHTQLRRGLPCDGRTLRDMLADMLQPPLADSEEDLEGTEGAHTDVERAAVLVDDSLDPISMFEERLAAREAEAMKHPEF